MPSSSKIDSAILSALSLDTKDVKISPHGSSGFTSSYRLTTPTTSIFVKTSSTNDAATMFEGEHTSLNAIHSAAPSLAPQSFAWGKLSNSSGYFLATEFLDMSSRSSGSTGSGQSLAQKLATLHTSSPPPEHKDLGFGFPVPTCCGSTIQDNTWKPTWSTFFAENRLLHILKLSEQNHGPDKPLRTLIEQTVETVVPRLLRDGHLGGPNTPVQPVLTHGDLWSGNKTRATFLGRADSQATEPVIFDPSSAYCHSEYDHGIMNMFGGFDRSFWKEYFGLVGGKTEPVEEYEDRVKLYECYHQLNHYAMFGGGYKGAAVGILRGLLGRYGGDGDGKG